MDRKPAPGNAAIPALSAAAQSAERRGTADPLRPRRHFSLGALDRAPVRRLFLAGRPLRDRLRCLGVRLSWLWIFGPISRDERAAASEPTVLSHSGRERAARGGSPLHSQLAWSAESFAHQPLVGFNAGWPFRRTASHNGGPHGVIWRHHPPAAAQIRKAARGAGMAHR